MRTFIINILAVIGMWCCQKAINMADDGHLEFEVVTYPKQPTMIYNKKSKRKSNLKFVVLVILVAGFLVWSVLTLAYSIDDAGQKVTKELKREHKEEMKTKFIKSQIYRKYCSFN